MIINCRKCKQDKDIEDFPKHKTSRLGVEKQCKKCKSKNKRIVTGKQIGRAHV